MRSISKTLLVTLGVICAFTAVATASASAALPEFNATKFPYAYTSKSGEVTLQAVKGASPSVKCMASTNSGEVFSFKSFAKVQVKYTGCKQVSGAFSCNSSGAAAGEIVTNALTAELVYIKKATKEVGQLFKPAVTGGALAEFYCGLTKTKLTGGVIAKLPNEQINQVRTSFTWNYTQHSGIQEPTEYEEGSTKIAVFLTGLGGEQTGEEAAETMTLSTAVEIKA